MLSASLRSNINRSLIPGRGTHSNPRSAWLSREVPGRRAAAQHLYHALGAGSAPGGDSSPPIGESGGGTSKPEALIKDIDDTNQLQTRLAAAIAMEDYKLASLLRDRLEEVMTLQAPVANVY